jgi:hypothetical protein
MKEETLLFDFLETNFKVEIDEFSIVTYDKVTSSKLNSHELEDLIMLIFNDKTFYNGTQDWLKSQRRKVVADVSDYLDNCTVRLGQCDWIIVDGTGKVINEQNIIKLFSIYNSLLVKKLYNDWYSDMVIDASEKIMGVT